MTSFSRRSALKVLGTVAASTGVGMSATSQAEDQVAEANGDCSWGKTHDRVWLGAAYWANPMEDWRVADGGIECSARGGDRNVHLLTHQFTNPDGKLRMTVQVKELDAGTKPSGAGFRVGIRSDLNEVKSNSFAKGGIPCGVVGEELVIGQSKSKLAAGADTSDLKLVLTGEPSGGKYHLTLTAFDHDNKQVGSVERTVAGDRLLGNVAVVSNFDAATGPKQGSLYRFENWEATGDAFTVSTEHQFGPLLWSMYTLNDSRTADGFILKFTALTGPLGEGDNQTVELSCKQQNKWVDHQATLDTDAWTATFKIPGWDASVDTPYKLSYRERHTDGSQTILTRGGTIRANPSGRPLRLGALTCQNDYAFPYAPVAENVAKLDPDMLYFSGDQLYENHGGYGIVRRPADRAILNYLRKYYQFGWAFGEVMRDRPTVVIPDDHDVFQGNIWGEGGMPMGRGSASDTGGYAQPARMVNVVHRTCTSHHPDPSDPKPCQQDISVYYTDLVYGDVGFAILADRQWKSAPTRVDTGPGRADHITSGDIDPKQLDGPELVLLGERQEEFLEQWAKNWDGHRLKVVFSQTVFAGVATHHGAYNGFLYGDLDCGGWPHTARNRAIELMKPGMPLHINGDQHLTTMVQYGVDEQRDGPWSFCTPAIAVGYPRWWRPDEMEMPHEHRPQHGLPNTGEFVDAFGNLAYVYAVGNPEVGRKRNRYELAHQKGSGFGLVTIDTQAKTYTCESFKFLVDASDGSADNQFPGWPVVIHQRENGGENVIA